MSEDIVDRLKLKHASLTALPDVLIAPSVALEPIEWASPLPIQRLVSSSRSLLLLLPWLYDSGAGKGALWKVEALLRAGWRVTVVATLHDPPGSEALRDRLMRLMRDLHVLPTMLRAVDMPRYLVHLCRSRGTDTFMIANAQFG